jgi:hypothetical protein
MGKSMGNGLLTERYIESIPNDIQNTSAGTEDLTAASNTASVPKGASIMGDYAAFAHERGYDNTSSQGQKANPWRLTQLHFKRKLGKIDINAKIGLQQDTAADGSLQRGTNLVSQLGLEYDSDTYVGGVYQTSAGGNGSDKNESTDIFVGRKGLANDTSVMVFQGNRSFDGLTNDSSITGVQISTNLGKDSDDKLTRIKLMQFMRKFSFNLC